MAPSHELRLRINGHIRDELAREGRLQGPTAEVERLVSKGYTQAEKALAEQLREGRRGRLLPDVQADRRREGRRAPGVGYRRQGRGRAARRRQGRERRLEARPGRRPERRHRGVPLGGDRASGRGPHPLDAERRRPRRGQQPHRRGAWASRTGASRSAWRTDAGSTCARATRSSGTSTTPGRPPCMRSRGARSTT